MYFIYLFGRYQCTNMIFFLYLSHAYEIFLPIPITYSVEKYINHNWDNQTWLRFTHSNWMNKNSQHGIWTYFQEELTRHWRKFMEIACTSKESLNPIWLEANLMLRFLISRCEYKFLQKNLVYGLFSVWMCLFLESFVVDWRLRLMFYYF